MSYASKELKTCSRCHSTVLEKYFLTNRKGELYKTCDNCRSKRNTDKAKERGAKYRAAHGEENREFWDNCKEENRKFWDNYPEINKDNTDTNIKERNKTRNTYLMMVREFKSKYKPVM